MPTVETVVIDPGGTGNYTSLISWEPAEEKNLVSADKIHQVVCKTTNGVADNHGTNPLIIEGWTTDSTRYISIEVDSAHKHAGVWNDAKFRITRSNSGIWIRQAHTKIDGFQIHFTFNATSGSGIMADNSSVGDSQDNVLTIKNCIAKASTPGSISSTSYAFGVSMNYAANLQVNLINLIAYDFYTAAAPANGIGIGIAKNVVGGTCTVRVYNCTMVGNGTNYVRYSSNAPTAIAKNCISTDSLYGTTYNFNGTWDATYSTNNIADGATPPGTNPVNAEPTYIDKAGRNLSLSPQDTVALRKGMKLNGDMYYGFSDSINGQSRSGAWDIGAYQYPIPAKKVEDVVVDPGGTGHYTSLVSWEPAEQKNLVALNLIHRVTCKTTNGNPDNISSLTINGWTTDSTRYISIEVDSAHRHLGKWNDTKYRTVMTSSTFLTISQHYTRINGIQHEAYDKQYGIVFSIYNTLSASIAYLINCIVKTTFTGDPGANKTGVQFSTAGTTANNLELRVINCIVYGFKWSTSSNYRGYGYYKAEAAAGTTTLRLYNCLAIDNGKNFDRLSDNPPTVVVAKNCISTDPASVINFEVGYDASSTNNVADGGTPPGSNPIDGEPLYVFKNGKDYHLQSTDTIAKGTGVDLSADTVFAFDYDVDYNLRHSTWDRGPDEYTGSFSINWIGPRWGNVNGGQSIVIKGSGFQAGATVTIGGTECTNLNITSSQITCTAPAKVFGIYDIGVTSGGETQTFANYYASWNIDNNHPKRACVINLPDTTMVYLNDSIRDRYGNYWIVGGRAVQGWGFILPFLAKVDKNFSLIKTYEIHSTLFNYSAGHHQLSSIAIRGSDDSVHITGFYFNFLSTPKRRAFYAKYNSVTDEFNGIINLNEPVSPNYDVYNTPACLKLTTTSDDLIWATIQSAGMDANGYGGNSLVFKALKTDNSWSNINVLHPLSAGFALGHSHQAAGLATSELLSTYRDSSNNRLYRKRLSLNGNDVVINSIADENLNIYSQYGHRCAVVTDEGGSNVFHFVGTGGTDYDSYFRKDSSSYILEARATASEMRTFQYNSTHGYIIVDDVEAGYTKEIRKKNLSLAVNSGHTYLEAFSNSIIGMAFGINIIGPSRHFPIVNSKKHSLPSSGAAIFLYSSGALLKDELPVDDSYVYMLGIDGIAFNIPDVLVSSIDKSSGQTGEFVTITGNGFYSGATVQFGSEYASQVSVVSLNTITCYVPDGAGTVDITVTNTDTSVGILASGFTYSEEPEPEPEPEPGVLSIYKKPVRSVGKNSRIFKKFAF